jgi:hypothetical protein
MTVDQQVAEADRVLSPAQEAGKACVSCGAEVPPFHPAETIEVRVAVGVVRDVETVRCTPCLVAAR